MTSSCCFTNIIITAPWAHISISSSAIHVCHPMTNMWHTVAPILPPSTCLPVDPQLEIDVVIHNDNHLTISQYNIQYQITATKTLHSVLTILPPHAATDTDSNQPSTRATTLPTHGRRQGQQPCRHTAIDKGNNPADTRPSTRATTLPTHDHRQGQQPCRYTTIDNGNNTAEKRPSTRATTLPKHGHRQGQQPCRHTAIDKGNNPAGTRPSSRHKTRHAFHKSYK